MVERACHRAKFAGADTPARLRSPFRRDPQGSDFPVSPQKNRSPAGRGETDEEPAPLYNQSTMKFGRIKRQHGRVGGLDEVLNRIIRDCPHVTRIVPGRIKVRRGHTPPSFKIQYPTQAGLKCLYTATGTVQEVFLICSDLDAAKAWLVAAQIAEAQ